MTLLAEKHLLEAAKIAPRNAFVLNELGSVLGEQGKIGKALQYFRQAVQFDPDYAKAQYNLAKVLEAQGNTGQAINHYRQALRTRPDWPKPINVLAWLLATTKDPNISNAEEAVQLGEKVCELTDYKDAGILDTLAAAYAAAGKFDKAIETAEKAISISDNAGQKKLSKEIRSRLPLYKSGRAYYEN